MRTVLVVEDDEGIRQLMTALLREDGFEQVLTATNGTQAVQLAVSNKLDLVVLDHSLAGESGIEVAERLRSLPGFRASVLVTTALPARDAEKVCQEAGACECLPKPFEITDFLDAVRACLHGQDSPLAA